MKKELCSKSWLVLPGLILPVLMLLSAGCKHVDGKYSSVHAPAVPKGPPANTVMISRKIEPDWLKPSPDLFTLGPGDRLETEVLGAPASRAITVAAPAAGLNFNFLP